MAQRCCVHFPEGILLNPRTNERGCCVHWGWSAHSGQFWRAYTSVFGTRLCARPELHYLAFSAPLALRKSSVTSMKLMACQVC